MPLNSAKVFVETVEGSSGLENVSVTVVLRPRLVDPLVGCDRGNCWRRGVG